MPSDEMGQGRPHLHGRTFTAERQPGADGDHAADEFHRDQSERRGQKFPEQHGLDVGNAAAGGDGGETAHKPRRESGRGRTERRHHHQTDQVYHHVGPVRVGDHPVAKAIGLLERQAKQRAHQSGGRARDEGKSRDHGQTPRRPFEMAEWPRLLAHCVGSFLSLDRPAVPLTTPQRIVVVRLHEGNLWSAGLWPSIARVKSPGRLACGVQISLRDSAGIVAKNAAGGAIRCCAG